MSNNRRAARVASLIRREISQMLMSGIKDDRIGGGMVSVTDVEVAGDLQHVKVFVSIYGDEAARQSAMEGLASATGFVRHELGKRVRLRRTPTVVFVEDKGIERGSGVLSLINQLSIEREKKGGDDKPFGELDDDHGEAVNAQHGSSADETASAEEAVAAEE